MGGVVRRIWPSLLGGRCGVGGGGVGMTPWCDDLVCSWRRLLADCHSLPFPWTLSLHRRWCPSASRHPVTFLFLPALTIPLPCPFLSLRRPRCPSASHHSFPSHSRGRLCQRSPRTCFTSLRRVHIEEGKCLRRWPGASKRPSQAGGGVSLPMGWPLAGSFPRQGHITTFRLQVPALSPSFGERNTNPLPSPSCLCCACCVPWRARVWVVAGVVLCWVAAGGSTPRWVLGGALGVVC